MKTHLSGLIFFKQKESHFFRMLRYLRFIKHQQAKIIQLITLYQILAWIMRLNTLWIILHKLKRDWSINLISSMSQFHQKRKIIQWTTRCQTLELMRMSELLNQISEMPNNLLVKKWMLVGELKKMEIILETTLYQILVSIMKFFTLKTISKILRRDSNKNWMFHGIRPRMVIILEITKFLISDLIEISKTHFPTLILSRVSMVDGILKVSQNQMLKKLMKMQSHLSHQ